MSVVSLFFCFIHHYQEILFRFLSPTYLYAEIQWACLSSIMTSSRANSLPIVSEANGRKPRQCAQCRHGSRLAQAVSCFHSKMPGARRRKNLTVLGAVWCFTGSPTSQCLSHFALASQFRFETLSTACRKSLLLAGWPSNLWNRHDPCLPFASK